MKTKLSILSMLALIIQSAVVFAQVLATTGNPAADSLVIQGRSLVDSGYVEWKKEEMLHGYALLQRAAVLAPENRYVEYYVYYAGYRLMTYGMVTRQNDLYEEFAHQAESGSAALARSCPDWSEPKTLLAAIYGIEIAHSWINAPTLGPKNNALAEEAIAIDSANPRAYMILGISKLNTPSIFGGSLDKAVELFQKSVSLFESAKMKPASNLEPSWGYVDALTWLGIAYEKQGLYKQALAQYQKTLVADPNYSRARYVLIPEVEKKIELLNKK